MDSEYTISESNIISHNYEDSDYNDDLYDLPRHRKKISRRRQPESSTSVNKPIEEYQFNEIFPGVNINAPIKINRINSAKKNVHQAVSTENSTHISNFNNNENTNNSENLQLNTTDNNIDTKESLISSKISTLVLPKSSSDLKLKKRITPTLITTSNYTNITQENRENSSQNLQSNQIEIRKKKKDIYDFNPIVDSETENRLKLLPKPIYKYIPKSPISNNSVEEKDNSYNKNNKKKDIKDKRNNKEKDNSTDDFIQFIEPSEEELASRIEYDMDEQGTNFHMVWLKKINKLRSKKGLKMIDPLFFERVMDKLEKEWFELNKNLPSEKSDNQSSEDSVCEICNNGECENSNAIVFCDGCNIAVHQDCYGVPFIPEGQWLCRKCMISPEAQVSCVLCPNKGGAFKQTDFNCWAHLSCAIWIPECSQANIFGLSEPIGRFDVIDVNVVDQIEFENKTSEGKDDQKIEGTLNNQFSVEVLSSIEVSKSDDIAITENPMSNLSQGSNIDKKPTKDLINSDQEKKDHSLNKEIKENMESSVSTENRTVLDKNSHSNSNDLNKPSNNEYSLLENKEENNESTASKLQSIPLDESDNKEIITHKLQEILSEENDKSSIPKLQEITSEFSDTMNQNITVENNDKNSLESLAVVKNTSMSEEVIKNKGKKENTTLKENSQIKNALSKIRNNQLSIKKNDININNNNLTNEKLPVSKINKKIDQEKAQNESVDDSRNDETNNNSIIDIDATELNESTVENISHLDEEVINNPDLLSDENKNEKEIKNDDKKNKNTMEDHHLLSRDSTLIDVNIAIAKSDTSLKENNFIKGKANKELQASKMENKQENKNEIIETIIVDDAEKNNDNEKNDSIEISEKNDTIKPKLISKESGLTDSLEKTTKKTHVGRKLKTRSKGKSENGKEDASSIPISKPSKNENNDKVTDDPTDNKDNKDGISQMEESKETLPVLRKSKRFRKKKNNEPIVNVIDETNNKESNDFNSSNTLNKSNDNDGNGPVHMQKRKFEDRDLVQGYLDENNQYHETEELKARYRELERELKESEILDDTSDISVNLPDENESLGSLSISDGDEHFLNIYSLTKNDDLDSEFTSLFHKINKDAHQTINSINKEQQQTGERKTRSKTKANKKLTEKESIEFDMNSTMTSSSSYEIIDIDDVESDQELSYTDKSQQLQKKKENEESDFEKFLKVYSRNKNLALRINMKEQEEEKSKAKGELEKKDSQKSKKDNKEKGDGNQDGKVIQKPARKRGRPPLRSSPAKKLRSSSRLNNENTSKVKSFKNDSSDKDNKNDVIKIPPDNKDATEIPPPNNDTIVEQQPPVNISIIEIPPDDEDDTKIPSNNDDVIEILPSNNEAIKKSFNNNRRNKRKEKNTRNDNINKLDSTPLDNTLNSSNMVTKGRGRKKKTKTEEIVGNNNEKEEDVSESQAIDEYKRITRSSSRSKNSSASTSRNSSRSNSQKSSQSNSPIICQSNKEQSLPTILEDENVDSLEENKDTYSLRTRHTIKKGVKNNNENNNSNNNNNNTTSSTESSQSNPNKRKSDEAKQETDKIYPSKRANNTKSNSDIITSPTSSTSSSSSNRVRHKRILPKSSGPSSTTKTKEIIISENELLFRKNKAVKQFRKRIDESNKLFSSNELDDDKDWISFLKYECGADIISDHLTNKNHKKRGWYWKRI
ncbi:hypothetical protein PIROE2DRAFT_11689 [Piromyces sp. E2]|nr:hypothetical protein PIROE2DRAFT_11689 [Piromyces sp. E2]|eukprot:OUM62135.1 hypothetical protein PIROE2DRAFT_11689 [Piromyces sp. E2]